MHINKTDTQQSLPTLPISAVVVQLQFMMLYVQAKGFISSIAKESGNVDAVFV